VEKEKMDRNITAKTAKTSKSTIHGDINRRLFLYLEDLKDRKGL